MNIALKAKVKLLLRTFPKPAQWLIRQLMEDSESTEKKYRERIAQLEREMWYWKDKYQDVMLSGRDEES